MNRQLAGIPRSGNSVPASVLNMDCLLTELDYHRGKAQRLSLINELHGRLASAIDLPRMIEALSGWMLSLVDHELIGYNHPGRNRQSLFCRCHGPKRQQLLKIAKKIFAGGAGEKHISFEDPFHVWQWRLSGRQPQGDAIILISKNRLGSTELSIVKEVLQILHEPLQRALQYEDLFEMANNDSLTGLANRRVFEDRIDSILVGSRRHNRPVSLAIMDLDYFKQVNDTYGHGEGDRVLRRVAHIMRKTVRSTDLLARMGGDEFILVLPDTPLESARYLAERLCRAVHKLAIEVPGGKKLGVSIGLIQYQPGMSKEHLLVRADEILYRAKSAGRSQVCTGS
jgi:diguanylate cyclase (GGDEF)-like protein